MSYSVILYKGGVPNLLMKNVTHAECGTEKIKITLRAKRFSGSSKGSVVISQTICDRTPCNLNLRISEHLHLGLFRRLAFLSDSCFPATCMAIIAG